MAHRGGAGLGPEHTIPIFKLALALGVNVLEMDVRQTRDGVLVCLHDPTVDRTTNGNGRVSDLRLAELKQLDAGYRWTAPGDTTYPFRGQGFTVPTLKEVFETFPEQRMVIEIKQQSPPLAPALCNTLRDFDKTDQVLVASFRADAMEEFRTACPQVATAASAPEVLWFYTLQKLYLGAAYQPSAQALQVPEYWGPLRLVDPRFVQEAGNHNMAVHVWTVDETADMRRLLEWGVNGLITNHPERLLYLLYADKR